MKVTLVPEQTAPDGEAAMLTLTGIVTTTFFETAVAHPLVVLKVRVAGP